MLQHLSSEKKQKLLSLGAIVLFLVFSGLVCWFIGRPMIRLASRPEVFRAWIDDLGLVGRFVFVGMMAFQVFIAIIPGEPLEIGAGYAFGFWEGTLLCSAGILLGSVLVFLFVRYFGIKAVRIFFSHDKISKLKFLQNTRKLNLITFIVFFIPGTPKDILTYFIGLTPMKMHNWILITFVARLPSIITSTIGGNALGIGNYTFAIMVFASTLVLSVLGLMIYRKIQKIHDAHHPSPGENASTSNLHE